MRKTVFRCLSVDRAERYASGRALLEVLERAAAEAPARLRKAGLYALLFLAIALATVWMALFGL